MNKARSYKYTEVRIYTLYTEAIIFKWKLNFPHYVVSSDGRMKTCVFNMCVDFLPYSGFYFWGYMSICMYVNVHTCVFKFCIYMYIYLSQFIVLGSLSSMVFLFFWPLLALFVVIGWGRDSRIFRFRSPPVLWLLKQKPTRRQSMASAVN